MRGYDGSMFMEPKDWIHSWVCPSPESVGAAGCAVLMPLPHSAPWLLCTISVA